MNNIASHRILWVLLLIHDEVPVELCQQTEPLVQLITAEDNPNHCRLNNEKIPFNLIKPRESQPWSDDRSMMAILWDNGTPIFFHQLHSWSLICVLRGALITRSICNDVRARQDGSCPRPCICHRQASGRNDKCQARVSSFLNGCGWMVDTGWGDFYGARFRNRCWKGTLVNAFCFMVFKTLAHLNSFLNTYCVKKCVQMY